MDGHSMLSRRSPLNKGQINSIKTACLAADIDAMAVLSSGGAALRKVGEGCVGEGWVGEGWG